ncbi:MAG: respiratory nitrate reductase subunit gamma [Candidatus Omnitrophica bacterium]|nr:respiratory nitrate reductase subunit gamma [Candidatus Omnitrophota bacterium]
MQGLDWLIGAVLPYVAAAVCLLGVAARALQWQFMPKHVRWTFYPAPQNLMDQARFMAAEIFTFRAILKQNKILWIGAWMFHISMGILVLWLVFMMAGAHVAALCWIGAILMGCTVLYLILYRLLQPAAKAVSTPVEYFNLGLFLSIVLASASMYFFQQPSIEEIRQYLLQLLTFQIPVLPQAPLFLLVLFLVEALMIYFPFSRMIHMVSKYFAFHRINWGH